MSWHPQHGALFFGSLARCLIATVPTAPTVHSVLGGRYSLCSWFLALWVHSGQRVVQLFNVCQIKSGFVGRGGGVGGDVVCVD